MREYLRHSRQVSFGVSYLCFEPHFNKNIRQRYVVVFRYRFIVAHKKCSQKATKTPENFQKLITMYLIPPTLIDIKEESINQNKTI